MNFAKVNKLNLEMHINWKNEEARGMSFKPEKHRSQCCRNERKLVRSSRRLYRIKNQLMISRLS